MPELPEVETITQRLAEILPGKKFASITVFKEKSFIGDSQFLIGQEVERVSRRAKVIHFHLSSTHLLLTHLKMTGQLIYVDDKIRVGGGHPTADWVQALPSSHTRIAYTFDDGSQLFFNDQRIFGWMKMVTMEEGLAEFDKFGPDVNEESFTADYLAKKIEKRTQAIKVVIMDNTVVAGLGNIYACDTLNLARISPFRKANTLSSEEIKRLVVAAKQIIALGISLKGTTFDDTYVDIHGFAGGYQTQVLTYGREGLPCFNCGNLLEKVQLAGRGTYFCRKCQV